MKVPKIILRLLVLITLSVSAASAQTTFTQTVTALNKGCNTGCTLIDVPGLNNNPAALIFAKSVTGSGATSNQIGALYRTYEHKWSIFNLNGASMVVGAKYDIEYYATPDANHFVYIVPPKVHSNDVAYIDHAGLNGNQNAQIRVFATNPTAGNSLFNQVEVGVAYDLTTSKWFIYNMSSPPVPVPSGTAYNVAVTGASVTALPVENLTATFVPLPKPTPGPAGIVSSPFLPPVTLAPGIAPPTGSAGGDLSGTYPNPTVKGLQGKPLSGNAPTVGQVLRWNGTVWEPATQTAAPVAKTSIIYFNQAGNLNMSTPNVDTASIPGLDNQSFTLTQSSRVVFHTTIQAYMVANYGNAFPGAEIVWLCVEIRNTSGVVVARATADSMLGISQADLYNLTAVGIGVLPAGTYYTNVNMNRQPGGAELSVVDSAGGGQLQGGQMIVKIFPD